MITAIVLAAGMSTRIGQPKQLLDYRGRPIIRQVVETVLESRVQNTLVVLGARAQEVSKALADLPISIVLNQDFAEGQGTSVRTGVDALLERSTLQNEPLPEGVLFALGDQPLLKSETIDLLMEKFTSHKGIVIPYYQGKRGNPVIFPRNYFKDLKLLAGDEGARHLISRDWEQVTRVEVDDLGVVFDIDTMEDYRQLDKLGGNHGQTISYN